MSGRYGDTRGYRLGFAFSIGLWLCCLFVVGLFLSMSLTGRVYGGVAINAFVTVIALTWFGGATAWLIAGWKSRAVDDARELLGLAYRGRPSDPALAEVWRWLRIWSWSLITFGIELGALVALSRLGVWS